MTVMFNKVIGLLSNGATIANGAGFILSRSITKKLFVTQAKMREHLRKR